MPRRDADAPSMASAFSSRALSVGVSVNATSMETMIDIAIVQPNWFRNLA